MQNKSSRHKTNYKSKGTLKKTLTLPIFDARHDMVITIRFSLLLFTLNYSLLMSMQQWGINRGVYQQNSLLNRVCALQLYYNYIFPL